MKTNQNLYGTPTTIPNQPVRRNTRRRWRGLVCLAVATGLLASSTGAPAQTYTDTVLHTFSGSPGDGAFGGSLLVTNSTVYGGTLFGGNSSSGTLYKVNTDGSAYQILHSFGASATDGATPILLGIIDGELTGVTESGGTSGHGTIFTYTPADNGLQIVHDFAGSPADGAEPSTAVHIGSTLYGITVSGGSNSYGTVYKFDLGSSDYQILHNFAGSPTDGLSPAGLELVGTALYGRTLSGGSNAAAGTIFTINPDGTGYQILHNFGASATDGAFPGMPLVVGSTIYGVTAAGGSSSNGTLYKVNTDGTGYQILRHFAGSPTDGARPTMLEIAGTTLYGVTWFGGSGSSGTVYKINTTGTGFQILHNFTGGPADGAEAAGLVGIVGSTLYGLTDGGGSNGLGTVFTVNTAGTGFRILHNFASEGPATELILVGSTIYGTTGKVSAGRGGISINPGVLFTLAAAGGPAATVATPMITPNGGTFSNSVKVTLSCATAGATIRYTLVVNGPPSSSLLYKNAAFTLTNSCTLNVQAAKTIKNKIADSAVATAVFTIIPPPPVTITTTSLPDGKFKVSYPAGVKIQATGGTLPYKWSLASGKLPPGLTLNATTGAIIGKPTKTGQFTFTVKVTDSNKRTATQILKVTIVN